MLTTNEPCNSTHHQVNIHMPNQPENTWLREKKEQQAIGYSVSIMQSDKSYLPTKANQKQDYYYFFLILDQKCIYLYINYYKTRPYSVFIIHAIQLGIVTT